MSTLERAIAIAAAAHEGATDKGGQPYILHALRVMLAADAVARRVKLADLADNLDRSRIPLPTARDRSRLKKYRAAVALLENEAASSGDPAAPRR